MKIIILGAGASKGTVNAPTANEFGKYVYDINPCYNDYPYLEAVINHLKKWPKKLLGGEEISLSNWSFDKVLGIINNKVKMRNIVDLNLSCAPKSTPSHKRIYEENYDPWSFASHELHSAIIKIYGT